MALLRIKVWVVMAGLVIMVEPSSTSNESGARRSLAVVVHKSSSVENLAAADLRKILSGQLRKWPDLSPVVVVEQPEESATQLRALQVLLRTTPAGYSRQLLQAQFQGKQLPTIKVLNSDETAIKFVWNVPGAIAVVDAVAAATATSRVKVLKLDGKVPGETGYALQ